MNAAEFRKAGYELIDLCADLIDKMRDRQPLPDCVPGYIREVVPKEPPEKPEPWKAIVKDIEPVILSGMSFWQHPHFHAYFASGNSWPSILGNIICNSFGGRLGTWEGCPASTELEVIVLDWCAKFLGLPNFFYSKLSNHKSKGGGCIQSSASESILLSLLAAKQRIIKIVRQASLLNSAKGLSGMEIHPKLVAYGTTESHSCFEKACMIANVRCRLLVPDASGSIRAKTLKDAVQKDEKKGLIPFFCNAILGSTSTCVFDDPAELGPICERHDMWLNCDAAYAGSSFSCPELRHLTRGLKFAWSIYINANKWMNVNFDCSLHWIREKDHLIEVMGCEDLEAQKNAIYPDYRYWGIPSSRRFRALKLWFTIRLYGVRGLREVIRRHIYLAKTFEMMVNRNPDFEIVGQTTMGLCCFRLKGEGPKWDQKTQDLLQALNSTHKIHMVPAAYLGQFCIRMAICSEQTTEADIVIAWSWISSYANLLLQMKGQRGSVNIDPEEVRKTVGKWAQYSKANERDFKQLEASLSDFVRRGSTTGPPDYIASSTSGIGVINANATISEIRKSSEDEGRGRLFGFFGPNNKLYCAIL